MKRTAVLLSLLTACIISIAQAQNASPKPDPEIQKLQVFVGHWTGEGEIKPRPEAPTAQKVAFEETDEMILSGFFLEVREFSNGTVPPELYIVGYDPAKKIYPVNWYTGAGRTMSGTLTCEGNTWILISSLTDGKPYQVRFTLTFAADRMSHTDKTEVSSDGKSWVTVYEGKLSKVNPETKK